MSWQTFYGDVGNRFGIAGRFYGAAGHRGQDFPAVAARPVPAYEGGTIVLLQFSTIIGQCVVVRLSDGLFAGYAHLKLTTPVLKVGDKVIAGQTIGLVAGPADEPGRSWSGPHLHTTLGTSIHSIFYGAVLDPLPRVKVAIAPPAVKPAKVKPPVKVGQAPVWAWTLPTYAMQVRIQRALRKRRRYFGLMNGWGRLSIAAIQMTIRGVGYAGKIDGKPGPMTCKYVQIYARKFGGYTGPIDLMPGTFSWAGFALGLERP